MLAKENRFHGSRDIRRLQAAGQKTRSKYLAARSNTQPGRPFQASIVVSRKVSKSAVVRNRIRRRLYELLRTEHVSVLDGVSLVIMAYDATLAVMPQEELRKELAALLSKARLTPPKASSRAIVDKRKD